jgi:hypothetical protein
MKAFTTLTFLLLAANAHAGVTCKIGGAPIVVSDSLADASYSPSGKRDTSNGRLSLFRLMTMDMSEGDGDTSSVELKTADVTKPGDYPLSLEPGWRSNSDVKGAKQRVTGGKFHFTKFELSGNTGRAVGTVDFTTEKTSGACTFDVTVQAINRDAMGF